MNYNIFPFHSPSSPGQLLYYLLALMTLCDVLLKWEVSSERTHHCFERFFDAKKILPRCSVPVMEDRKEPHSIPFGSSQGKEKDLEFKLVSINQWIKGQIQQKTKAFLGHMIQNLILVALFMLQSVENEFANTFTYLNVVSQRYRNLERAKHMWELSTYGQFMK